MSEPSRMIWVDKTIANRDGIDLERLRSALASADITIVYDETVEIGDGTVICPGCRCVQRRDRMSWQTSTLSPSGWRPMCRVCEGTTVSVNAITLRGRDSFYKRNPDLLVGAGTVSKRVRERELGLIEGSDKKRSRVRPRGRGRFQGGGY